ncbi:MAG: hypothetical protein ACTHU0_25895 [Kofleriaceae bacterium]
MSARSALRDLAVALAVAALLLVATRQLGLHDAYAPHGAYRAQVDAFLDGRLALSPHPDALAHDLAWTERGVQQVWGLGVPAWQTPFELFGRAIGVSPFPDRIPMLAWLALMLFVAIRGFGRREDEPWWIGAGSVLIAGLVPPLLTLVRSRIGVYEEAAIYAYGASILMLGGLAGFARRPSARGYLVLVGLAGLGGLFRPTVWFYGAATLVIASALWLRHTRGTSPRGWLRRAAPAIALGSALFVAGGGVLYLTNARRFGSGSEFGHRINLHSLPGNLVATRFSYPFERVELPGAAAELFGALFDRPEQRSSRGFYNTGLHVGENAAPRWREYYFTTYSWPYAAVLIAGLLIGVLAWRRRGAAGDPDARWLSAWALLGLAPLIAFYLWSPSLSSRYQLDLAPGFVALILIAWRVLARRSRPAVAISVLVLAWGAAVATSKTSRSRTGSNPVDRSTAAYATYKLSRPLASARALRDGYDLADPVWGLHSDVLRSFDRCADVLDAPIDCDLPAMAGDLHIHGARDELGWQITRARIPDLEPVEDPRCAPAPLDLVCRPAATLATDPDAIVESVADAPPPLYLNGFGWDPETGRVPVATFFYAVDPQLVEIEVAYAPLGAQREPDWERELRVNLDRDHLRLTRVQDTTRGVRLRFEPRAPITAGLHVVFIAFGPDRDLNRPQSDFVLHAIRWR